MPDPTSTNAPADSMPGRVAGRTAAPGHAPSGALAAWRSGAAHGRAAADRSACSPTRSSTGGAFSAAAASCCAQAYPQAQRVVVEPMPALVAAQPATLQRAALVDAERWRGAAVPRCVARRRSARRPAQLLWANMMLHAAPTRRRCSRAGSAAGGRRLPDVLVPRARHAARAARALCAARLAGPTPAFIDMHDLGDMLVHAGFADR